MNIKKAAVLAGALGAALCISAAQQVVAQTTAQPSAAAPVTAGAYPPAPRIPGQNQDGLRVYIRAGLKTHGPGQHDYPQFLADWSKILTQHGAVVNGSLRAPTAEELENTDVLVIYKGDAGYMTPAEKAALDAFVKRGGGVVSLHDGLCGPDPAYFASVVGGAKKHGEVNYTLEADIPYLVTDQTDPIMDGLTEFTMNDEAFFNMTFAESPKIKVLATSKIPATRSAGTHAGEVVPQIWSYEHTVPGGQPSRAFVSMHGHTYANLTEDKMVKMILRGIAWAGKRPVDELVDYAPPPPRRRGA